MIQELLIYMEDNAGKIINKQRIMKFTLTRVLIS